MLVRGPDALDFPPDRSPDMRPQALLQHELDRQAEALGELVLERHDLAADRAVEGDEEVEIAARPGPASPRTQEPKMPTDAIG